jgi:hypothetical protein
MANRHSNKKLRAAIRARMAATGEGYQKARSRLAPPPRDGAPDGVFVDVIEAPVFGHPVRMALVGLRVGGRASSARLMVLGGPAHHDRHGWRIVRGGVA